MRNRHIIHLGKTEVTNYKSSPKQNIMYFSVDSVNVSSIKKGHLTNSGLLSCSMFVPSHGGGGGEEEEIFKLNLVVNVVLNDEGEYVRTIYNPLE